MLQDRNRTVHTYNEETANQIIDQIRSKYFALFTALLAKFNSLSEQFELSLFDQIDNPALIEHIERCGKPLFLASQDNKR